MCTCLVLYNFITCINCVTITSVKIKIVEFNFKLSTCNIVIRIMTMAGAAKCMTSRYHHECKKKKINKNKTNKTQSL